MQWCMGLTGRQINLPITFSQVYRWAVAYHYYNNYICAVTVHSSSITTDGGPDALVGFDVIAIGI